MLLMLERCLLFLALNHNFSHQVAPSAYAFDTVFLTTTSLLLQRIEIERLLPAEYV